MSERDDAVLSALDEARQQRARERARISRRLALLELGLVLALLLAALQTGASPWLRDRLRAAGIVSPWLLVLAYSAIALVGYELLFLPLSYYRGYVLPHRYGLSTQSLRGWAADEAKSLGLALALGLPVATVVFWLLRTQPASWWWWAGLFFVLLGVLMAQLAPVLLVPLFNKLTPLDDPDLIERLRALAQRSGTRLVGVYTIDLSRRTTAANAVIMGLGRTKRIALGDTLYASYGPAEIEAIMAHELGHQVHHDLELGIVVQSALTFLTLYLAHLALRWGVERLSYEGLSDVAAAPLLVLVAAVASLLALPASNAYSRWREARADRYAVRVAQQPGALRSALLRLTNQNLSEADPPSWVVWLLYSHPPLRQRLANLLAAERVASGHGP